ncbi:MAG: hypothetical protein ACE5GW_06880 [Planctomycetota bacterium]
MRKLVDLLLVLTVLAAPVAVLLILRGDGGQPENLSQDPKREEQEVAGGDRARGDRGGLAGAGEEASPGETGSGEAVEEETTSAARIPALPVPAPLLLLTGTLLEEPLRPSAGEVLHVESAAGRSLLVTDGEGGFHASIPRSDLPASVATEPGLSLLEIEPPATGGSAHVNLHRFPARNGDGTLIWAQTVGVIRWEGGETRIQVRGGTRLPDGCDVILRLRSAARKTLEATITSTRGGALEGSLTLPQRGAYSGEYELALAWKPASATPEQRQAVEAFHAAPLPGEVEERHAVLLGRRGEALAQEREIRLFFREAIEEAMASRDLLHIVGARARGKRSKVLRDPLRMKLVRKHPRFAVIRELGRGKNFDFARWRRLIEQELPAAWAPFRDPGRIPYPQKHPREAQHLPLLFATLEKYARLESTLVYVALGKPRDKNDFTDFEWGPETERRQTMKRLQNFIDSIEDGLEGGTD